MVTEKRATGSGESFENTRDAEDEDEYWKVGEGRGGGGGFVKEKKRAVRVDL